MKHLIFPFLLLLLFSQGCEKVVDFDLEKQEPKLVVEATIENNAPPLVVLSRSFHYFSTLSRELLAQSFVHNAEVWVSNGTLQHRLKEYMVPAGNGFQLYYYTLDTARPATAFLEQLNGSYTLKILSEGKEYTAETTIPAITKRLDSFWSKPAKGFEDSSKAVILTRVTDRPGLGDYIRYYTKRNGEPFFPALNSVFDDLVIDGKTYELQLDPGVDRNAEREEEEHFFNKGDTVTLKLCNIDKPTFDFWRTIEYGYACVGNPFSSPVKVLGNIRGGAVGYFGGFAAQYHTIVIPK